MGEMIAGRVQRPQALAEVRVAQRHAERSLELVVTRADAALVETQGERREQLLRLRAGDFRRRLDAEQLRGEGDLLARGGRLVVHDVENPVRLAGESRVDRLG